MFVSRNKKIVRMVRQSCGIVSKPVHPTPVTLRRHEISMFISYFVALFHILSVSQRYDVMQAIFSHTSNPEPVLALLKSHLPYSLPLFRRLQFMSIPGGSTPSSHILCSFPLEPEKGEVEGEGKRDGNEAFTVAYLDLSRGPETEMWMYSSFEHPSHNSPAATTECLKQVLAVLKHVGGLVKDWEKELEERGEGEGGKRNTPGVVLCGTLYDEIFRFLDNERALGSSREVVVGASPENLKFMFTKDKLPVQKELPDGFEWGIVGVEDLELVLRRTGVPRKV